MPVNETDSITNLTSEFTQLINKLKNFFNHISNTGTVENTTIKPAIQGYQAPIKGTWYNSGGFDPGGNIKRPNGRKGHQGLDLRAQGGTPIYPIAPGTVTNVGTDPLGGNVVNVKHDQGVTSYYAHLATAKVQKGDNVNYDTVLGTVGDSGNAKGTVYHCHLQIWKNNQIQDPARFFPVPTYSNVSDSEKANGSWVSDQAKQEAASFNMNQHTQQKLGLLTAYVDRFLTKTSNYFFHI